MKSKMTLNKIAVGTVLSPLFVVKSKIQNENYQINRLKYLKNTE